MEHSLPALRPAPPTAEIAALAGRQHRAGGALIALMNRLGGGIEAQMALLPQGVQRQIERLVTGVLQQGHAAASLGRRAPRLGHRAAPALAALSGAAGGAGGLATSLAELPFTVTLILHAIRRAAEDEGFDPDAPEIRAQCLQVFSAGSPLEADDGVNTAFLGARLTVTGPALQKLIASVAPRLATALGQKLAAQAVPVLGAISGAALNAAYLSYYRELAQIRFALLRLAQVHGAEPVLAAFAEAAKPRPVLRA
jgi:hypothetical protein